MVAKLTDKKNINHLIKAASHLLKLPEKKMWIDYDEGADALYISFNHPQKATDSEMSDNGILLRWKKKQLVGITILDASKRA